MSAGILIVALALGQGEPDKAVTDAEKEEFLNVLAKLPTRGEFFSDDAVTMAVPYTRVLLALTEKDLTKRDLYPFLALSRGLLDRKEPRQYGRANFAKIAHPMLKLLWASVLFDDRSPPPEVVSFLYKALGSKDGARALSEMGGPGFEDFRQRVIRAYKSARPKRIELVKEHTIDEFPEYGGFFGYTNDRCVFAPGPRLVALRPLKQRGELIALDLAKGKANRLAVPQPAGFKARYDFLTYFDHPVLSINARGDLFCRWMIGGNGDHGLALLKKGSDSFVVRRIDLALADCLVVADPDGAWFLIRHGPECTVYQIDRKLQLVPVGKFARRGHHSIRIADARFLSKDVLHLFWADVLPQGNQLRMRCVDFDVNARRWLHNREIFRLDTFVGDASEPAVLELKDGSLHYLWRVDEGAKHGEATGLYYQAEADGKTVKVGSGYRYRAAAVGDGIVVCYALDDSPEKVYFRVIHHGTVGPSSEITAARGQKHGVFSECMLLHAESDCVWFMNTLTRNTLYELRLVDAKTP